VIGSVSTGAVPDFYQQVAPNIFHRSHLSEMDISLFGALESLEEVNMRFRGEKLGLGRPSFTFVITRKPLMTAGVSTANPTFAQAKHSSLSGTPKPDRIVEESYSSDPMNQ
jgi:hypothetical protein